MHQIKTIVFNDSKKYVDSKPTHWGYLVWNGSHYRDLMLIFKYISLYRCSFSLGKVYLMIKWAFDQDQINTSLGIMTSFFIATDCWVILERICHMITMSRNLIMIKCSLDHINQLIISIYYDVHSTRVYGQIQLSNECNSFAVTDLYLIKWQQMNGQFAEVFDSKRVHRAYKEYCDIFRMTDSQYINWFPVFLFI